MMQDGNTKNWPKLVPFVQGVVTIVHNEHLFVQIAHLFTSPCNVVGQINCIKHRGYKKSPYEMVHGCTMRSGYLNNNLSPTILKVLLNEDGLDALAGMDNNATEEEVVEAIGLAQSTPMLPAEERTDKTEACATPAVPGEKAYPKLEIHGRT